MNKKNLITLAVVLVVGYLLWNMSKKQQTQQCPQGQVMGADGVCAQQVARFRK